MLCSQFFLPNAICSRFVNALVFFGISLNVGNLAGDIYLNFFILSIVELPGGLLVWFFMSRYFVVSLYTVVSSVNKRNSPFCIS